MTATQPFPQNRWLVFFFFFPSKMTTAFFEICVASGNDGVTKKATTYARRHGRHGYGFYVALNSRPQRRRQRSKTFIQRLAATALFSGSD